MCLEVLGDLPAALDACDQVLERAPRRELALTDGAVIAQRMGLSDRSLLYMRKAIALNPTSTRYRFILAQLLWARGDRDGAAAECRALLA